MPHHANEPSHILVSGAPYGGAPTPQASGSAREAGHAAALDQRHEGVVAAGSARYSREGQICR